MIPTQIKSERFEMSAFISLAKGGFSHLFCFLQKTMTTERWRFARQKALKQTTLFCFVFVRQK